VRDFRPVSNHSCSDLPLTRVEFDRVAAQCGFTQNTVCFWYFICLTVRHVTGNVYIYMGTCSIGFSFEHAHCLHCLLPAAEHNRPAAHEPRYNNIIIIIWEHYARGVIKILYETSKSFVLCGTPGSIFSYKILV